jgi:hypothetical protein
MKKLVSSLIHLTLIEKRKEVSEMFGEERGQSVMEWLVGALIVILLGAAAVYTIMTNANAEGGSAASWIDALNVPSSP